MLDLHPFTILSFVLVVLIFKNGVKAIGKPTILDKAWSIYTWLGPKLGHVQLIELQNKKQQHVEITKQKKQISAQDEYAKWTKLNRQADKLLTEITQLNESIAVSKASVAKYVGILITVLTSLPIWFCRAWFRKSILFYLPVGVLPHYLEWCFALPFLPTGSVGLTVWMFAVNYVIGSIIFGITFLLESPVAKPDESLASKPAKSTNFTDSTELIPNLQPQQGPEPEITAEKIK